MTARFVRIDDIVILVEVDDLESIQLKRSVEGTVADKLANRGLEPTGVTKRISDINDDLRNTLRAVIMPLRETLISATPNEFTIEFELGFKGEAGIPCITKGEANGSIKITAKWKFGG